ncbi:hypothetical protein TCAP_03369 [Tolypocladium capitatum]|uniref:Uncharacterized protein n=1 Tax=Tolypocladium capitatum TaxID=45235 RepID=A0A2K3QGQ8_9HYPO|nr:hypothetical protein TCAP_03369 [Tolypocladium capitatum]
MGRAAIIHTDPPCAGTGFATATRRARLLATWSPKVKRVVACFSSANRQVGESAPNSREAPVPGGAPGSCKPGNQVDAAVGGVLRVPKTGARGATRLLAAHARSARTTRRPEAVFPAAAASRDAAQTRPCPSLSAKGTPWPGPGRPRELPAPADTDDASSRAQTLVHRRPRAIVADVQLATGSRPALAAVDVQSHISPCRQRLPQTKPKPPDQAITQPDWGLRLAASARVARALRSALASDARLKRRSSERCVAGQALQAVTAVSSPFPRLRLPSPVFPCLACWFGGP